jgi:glycosyltransferase involved in cell wall biosynthesis
MRILMLGWEFPPFISGGLGQACFGLTRALDAMGHDITFVLPRPVDRDAGLAPGRVSIKAPGDVAPLAGSSAATARPAGQTTEWKTGGLSRTRFIRIPATFTHPYPAFEADASARIDSAEREALGETRRVTVGESGAPVPQAVATVSRATEVPVYGFDLVADANRYATLAVALTRGERFDVIHAHDWLTFPAGIMLAAVSGKPLVVHLHSTEYDRAGNNPNARVVELERAGMQAASRVFAVSQLTKAVIVRRYGTAPSKVDVVYNGIDAEPPLFARAPKDPEAEKIVLFLGRITWQKGPEHFINAAKRVLEVAPRTRFVLAGSGDMSLRMMELANTLGIGGRIHFTGFLGEEDVARMLDMADVFVMPSVSEPFGIAALEALSHQVPVILSRTSGAAEVIQHALKVDFWDVDDLANKIVSVLRNPALASTLRVHSAMEVAKLDWTSAARRCLEGYAAAGVS